MTYAFGKDLGSEVCEVLGLHSTLVQRIQLVFDVSDLVRADITQLVTQEQYDGLISVLKCYELEVKGVKQYGGVEIKEGESDGYADSAAMVVCGTR